MNLREAIEALRESEAEITRIRRGVSEAAAAERRQTQRRMIAALYWRAGEAQLWAAHARRNGFSDASTAWLRGHNMLRVLARDMEAAL